MPAVGPGGSASCAATMRLLYKLEFGPSSAMARPAVIAIPAYAIAIRRRFIFILRTPHSAIRASQSALLRHFYRLRPAYTCEHPLLAVGQFHADRFAGRAIIQRLTR